MRKKINEQGGVIAKPKSIKKNYIFNLIYQLLLIIAPLITTPYVARVLGVEGVGVYSYSNSLVTYFVLFATLGTTTYAQRKISYTQKSAEERSRAFWEIFIFRLIVSTFTLAVYLILFTLILKENIIIYLLLGLNILNVVFDVSWFFQGMEEFSKTVIINSLFKILSVVFIFLFVKSSNDLYVYVLLISLMTVLGNISLWLYLPKYLCKVKGIKPFHDLKGILQLFIPTLAIQIYTVLDKSMIGWFTEGNIENGYYEQAEKIVKMTLTVVVSLGTVMIPRISQKFIEGDNEGINNYLYKSYRFVWMIGLPIAFGLISISGILIPVFLGGGYEKCEVLIQILSALTVIIGLSNVTGMQYFVPVGKQNILTLTVTVGAVINVILNLILIPLWQSLGACIASVIAEMCVTLSGFIYIKRKKLFPLKPIFSCVWNYLLSGIVMFCSLMLLKLFMPVAIWSLIILIVLGIIIYFAALLILRDNFLLNVIKKALSMVKKVFSKK